MCWSVLPGVRTGLGFREDIVFMPQATGGKCCWGVGGRESDDSPLLTSGASAAWPPSHAGTGKASQ